MSKIILNFLPLLIIFSLANFYQILVCQNKPKPESYSAQQTDSKTSNEYAHASPLTNIINWIKSFLSKIKESVTNLFSKSGSKTIRFLAALLLGILLSLTPCIYPMIPVTVGILQINKTNSIIQSFILAGAYTLGISIVFASLGFIAAIGGAAFGQVQSSPYIIIPLVILLLYLGLSMLGFYELYIPRFLQPKAHQIKGGSIVSAFTFGAISGLVASPCLSPGLVLILDYVSSLSAGGTLGNYLEGFGLLFAFGVGSSLPLLIIGTISTSMKVLPKAGQWMIEVKKLVGLMLIGMAFYHLSHLSAYIPNLFIVVSFIATLVSLGLYYFKSVNAYDSTQLKVYKQIVGGILIIASVVVGINKFKEQFLAITTKPTNIWLKNLDQALDNATQNNKPLFIDIESSVCAACKSIEKKLVNTSEILGILALKFIPLKITQDINIQDFKKLNEKYGPIRGFPTYLIIDSDGQLRKKIGPELGDLNTNEIINFLLN